MRFSGRILAQLLVPLVFAAGAGAQEPDKAAMPMHGVGGKSAMGGMCPHMSGSSENAPLQGLLQEAKAYIPSTLLDSADVLALTDEQAERLQALASGLERATALADAEVQGALLVKAWQASAADANALRERAETALEAHRRSQLAFLDTAAQARALLTPEQQSRIASAPGAGMRGMMERMGGMQCQGAQGHGGSGGQR